MSEPELRIITGPMFAKKTSRLIQEIEDSVVAKNTILVLRPILDNRQERNFFTKIKENHSLAKYSRLFCEEIREPQEIIAHVNKTKPNVIIIDEVQFLGQSTTGIIQGILDKRSDEEDFLIVAAGLETDYRRELFGPTHQLMAIADKVTKLKAVCNRCRKKNAIYTWRKGDSNLQVIVGGQDMYEARCRRCWHFKEASE